MLSKTKIALSAAFVLSTAFPALAATRHHQRVTHIRPAMIYNIYKRSQTALTSSVRRMAAHLAVAIARGRALVHHQIAGDRWATCT
jgi:hypothetical protein